MPAEPGIVEATGADLARARGRSGVDDVRLPGTADRPAGAVLAVAQRRDPQRRTAVLGRLPEFQFPRRADLQREQ